LNRLYVFAILVRVADDLALRQAVHPLNARSGAAFAPRTHLATLLRAGWNFFRRLLLPAAAGGDVEFSDVAALELLQRIMNLAHVVELG
jgi:hypothetical protein